MRYIKIIAFLLLTLPSFGQVDTTRPFSQVSGNGYEWNQGRFRSALRIPRDTFPLKVIDSGAIVYTGRAIYAWSGYAWVKQKGTSIWYNVAENGGDKAGIADASPLVNNAIKAGFKAIYFPEGKYNLASPIMLHDSVAIFGDGRNNSILKTTSNGPVFKAGFTSGGFGSQLSDFTIEGSKSSGASTDQEGILIDSVSKVLIQNVTARNIGGYAFHIKRNGYCCGTYVQTATRGNILQNLYVESSYGAVYLDTMAEYNTVANSTLNGNTYGIRIAGGNNAVIGNNITANTYGAYLTGGSNNGHGTMTGNTINHNQKSLYIDGCTLGMSITGNNIHAEDSVVVKNSSYVNIVGGWIYAPVIYFNNSYSCTITGTNTLNGNEPVITVGTGEAPTYIKAGKVNNTLSWIDSKNTREFRIAHTNGIAKLSGMDSLVLAGLPVSAGSDSNLVITSGGVVKKSAPGTAANIYTADGVITSDRYIQGRHKRLTFGSLWGYHPDSAFKALYIGVTDSLQMLADSIIAYGQKFLWLRGPGSNGIYTDAATGMQYSGSKHAFYGRVGLNKATPAYWLDVAGSVAIKKDSLPIKAVKWRLGVDTTTNQLVRDSTGSGDGTNIYNSSARLQADRYISGNNTYSLRIDSVTKLSVITDSFKVTGNQYLTGNLVFSSGTYPRQLTLPDASTLKLEATYLALTSNHPGGNVTMSTPGGIATLTSGGQFSVGSYTPTAGAKLHVEGKAQITDQVAIGTSTAPAASALVDMVSTGKGLLIPRMTTAQRDAISSPATGLTIYNTSNIRFENYNGNRWTWNGAVPETQNSSTVFNLDTIPSTALRNHFNVSGMTAGISTNSRELRLYPTMLVVTTAQVTIPGVYWTSENYTYVVQVRVPVIAANTAIGLGFLPDQFRNAGGNKYTYSSTFNFTSTSASMNFYTGLNGTFTSRATTSALTIATNDTLEITVRRDTTLFTTTVRNLRTGTTQSMSYTYPISSTSNPVMPVGGLPCLYNLSSADTIDVLKWTLTDNTPQGCKLLALTDSKGNYNATTSADRWVSKFNATYGAGTAYAYSDYGGELADGIRAIGHIRRLRPRNLVITMGSNDVRNSVTEATYTANLRAIIDAAEQIGTKVYFMVMGESSLNQSPLYNNAKMLLGDRAILVTPALDGDGIHLTTAGHLTVYNCINSIITTL